MDSMKINSKAIFLNMAKFLLSKLLGQERLLDLKVMRLFNLNMLKLHK